MSLPALFISHGAPDIAIRDTPATRVLRQLGESLGAVEAIVVASAHWLSARPLLSAQRQPRTLHDFYWGPDAELYQMEYPAKGHPRLAAEIAAGLLDQGIGAGIDVHRGMDHGVWTPLVHLRPDADIPVVALSTQPQRGAEHHLALGRALAPLRDQGVLIIASGAITHNLRGIGTASAHAHALEFSQWAKEKIEGRSLNALLNYVSEAPHAATNHPTPEHFLPLFVALGAAEEGPWSRLHTSWTHGVLAMDIYRFG